MITEKKTDKLEIIKPDDDTIAIIGKILKLNEEILRQNGALISILSNPRILFKSSK